MGTLALGLPLIWARYYAFQTTPSTINDSSLSALQPLFKDQCFNSSQPLCFHPLDSSVIEFLNTQKEFNLGWEYFHKQNYQVAVEHSQIAAEKGYPEAQNQLGYFYMVGKGVEQNLETAEKYFLLAADQGDQGAQFTLGLMHEHTNFERALDYFKLAGDKGHLKAQDKFVKIYSSTSYKDQNFDHLKTAIKYCKKAANQGSEEAKTLLDKLYEKKSFLVGN